jgi:hypothetical protein
MPWFGDGNAGAAVTGLDDTPAGLLREKETILLQLPLPDHDCMCRYWNVKNFVQSYSHGQIKLAMVSRKRFAGFAATKSVFLDLTTILVSERNQHYCRIV